MLYSLNVIPSIFSIVLFGWMSAFMWRQRDIRGARALSVCMFSTMLVTAIMLLAVSLRDRAAAVSLLKTINFFGDCIGITAFVVMIAQYSGNRFFMRPPVIAVLAIIPFMTFIFAQTGSYYHYDYRVVDFNGWRIIEFGKGPWHNVNQAFWFSATAIDLYMLIRALYDSKRQRFVSTLMLIFVSIFPFISAFVFFNLGSVRIPPINFNPYIYAFGGLIAMAALYMARGQELIPIARSVVVESTKDIMLILNTGNIVVDFNDAAAGALGLSWKEIIGRPVGELLSGWGEIPRFLEKGAGGSIKQHIAAVKGKMTCILTVTPINDNSGERLGRLLVFHDITEMEQREKMEQRARQLQELSHGVIMAQEEERSRIGRELHDDFGHKLLTMSMRIEALRKKGIVSEQDIAPIEDLVQGTADDLMRIYRGLKPTVIEHLGLSMALEYMVKETGLQHNIAVETDIDPVEKDELDFKTALGVFRIAQESLTNIIKHAGAKKVRVELRKNEKEITLRVEDDGIGMQSGAESTHTGIGVIGMRERALAMRGNIEIESAAGGGTTVFLSVPISNDESGERS